MSDFNDKFPNNSNLGIETALTDRPAVEPNDVTALSEEQQTLLFQLKKKKRFENEHYLRDHPEVKLLVQAFLRKVLLERPINIEEFAGDFFTRQDLKECINNYKIENST